ncbi:AMP-binding protein [Sulfitobacter sp. M57]|uniref:AMP-binding protein n=1 Tax=unclassified Sulfitobacter TaxID=196795 RepID=UPI0023E148C8|nr:MULTISPECIES: AMP-binding protein [unclassified Sulfitobacter]MDF3413222.1 AMP-binding protein [Sulfitobacter sp. KE5]MDF3421495.1 AMP-binding protein [Sulfitobacter sp. KE43]MDF3431771.1 AMP-binding protein [Sulfitobacter sp. KE42]MDF3457411.1 AMP-binding protein [Sulfitobacter sp. S74]MDF3461314.1 AMP-binding protein [Sulfitobacter sp. Ks18]
MTKATVADFDQQHPRGQLEEQAARGASALCALGGGADVPVAVIMRNDVTQLEIMRAAAQAGTVIVALNWHGEADEVAAICDDSGAQIVIIHRDLIKAVRPALQGRKVIGVTPGPALCAAYNISPQAAATDPDSPEWSDLVLAHDPLSPREVMRPLMRYTSGSTGRPKGVRRSSGGPRKDFEVVLTRIATEMMRLRPGARYFTAAPIYHSAPSTLTSAALVSEAVSTVIAPKFEPESFLATIEAQKITHVYLVPTMMSRLLKLPDEVKARYDLSSIEFCISTGSPWPHELKTAMIDWWGPVFWESYGATEIGFMTIVSSEEALAKPGTAGRPQMGCTILILDEAGSVLPAGETGEIYARMDAFGSFDYSNDPESRQAAEKHGHCSIGDMGWLDEDGFLFITDRKKDMIISGGANIFPAEIEAVLMQAPFVRDVAVFGAPDAEFGEKIVAAIEPVDGSQPSKEEVAAFLEGKLARFKHPRIIDFHTSLPREDSGKIFKPRLRAPYWEGEGRKI